jgi:hypothetical protein
VPEYTRVLFSLDIVHYSGLGAPVLLHERLLICPDRIATEKPTLRPLVTSFATGFVTPLLYSILCMVLSDLS